MTFIYKIMNFSTALTRTLSSTIAGVQLSGQRGGTHMEVFRINIHVPIFSPHLRSAISIEIQTKELELLFCFSWQAGRWHRQLAEEAHRARRRHPERGHRRGVSDRW